MLDAALDQLVDLRILGLDRRQAAVQQRDLPVAARARALHADDELAGVARVVGRVGDHRRHHRADEADADDDDDLAAVVALFVDQLFQALELDLVVRGRGDGELLSGRTDRKRLRGHASLS